MKALLLAAGLGTRFLPLTQVIPKPAIPFMNVPLGCYSLSLLKAAGVSDFVVNTHHLPEKIKALYEARRDSHMKSLVFSDEQPKILGSGGALKHAQPWLQGSDSFWVANSDMVILPYEAQLLSQMLDFHLKHKNLATYLVQGPYADHETFSRIWTDEKRNFINFGPQKPHHTPTGQTFDRPLGWRFTGLALYSQEIFNWLPEAGTAPHVFTHGVLPALKENAASVKVFPYEGEWLENESIPDLLLSTEKIFKLMEFREIRRTMEMAFQDHLADFDKRPHWWQGNNCKLPLLPPETSIFCGNNVHIEAGAQIEGYCVIGDDSVISANAHLENCIIGPRQRVDGPDKKQDGILWELPGLKTP